jgi:tetratricopeptide (TPR) repeat protein
VASPVLIAVIGVLFIGLFAAMSLLRREGFSHRFVVEAGCVTAVFVAADLAGIPINPVLFLIVLYLLPTRTRLLVDLANLFARQGRYEAAEAVYSLAAGFLPDAAERLIVEVNRGVCLLKRGDLDGADAALRSVLEAAGTAKLGLKYQTACRYNMGIVFRKKGMEDEARREFQAVLELWPVSEVARQAALALRPRNPG